MTTCRVVEAPEVTHPPIARRVGLLHVGRCSGNASRSAQARRRPPPAALPLNSDAKKTITVTSDQAIVRDPSHRFGQGMRHTKAVKGILVVCEEPF